MADTKSKPKTEHERQIAKIQKLIDSKAIPEAMGKATIDALIASKAAPQVRTPEKAKALGVPAPLVDAVIAAIKAINDHMDSVAPTVDGKKEPTHRARWFFNSKAEDSGKADAKGEGEGEEKGEEKGTGEEKGGGEQPPADATVPPAQDAATVPPTPAQGKGKGKGKNPTV